MELAVWDSTAQKELATEAKGTTIVLELRTYVCSIVEFQPRKPSIPPTTNCVKDVCIVSTSEAEMLGRAIRGVKGRRGSHEGCKGNCALWKWLEESMSWLC